MFNWIDMKTQLLTRKVLHGCPWRLTPPALELFRQQSSLGKIGKEEPCTLEIISYWSDKLSSILDYFTFDPQKKVFYQFSAKVRCYLFITSSNPHASPSSKVPASRVPKSHVPTSPHPTSSSHFKWQPLEFKLPGNVTTRRKWIKTVEQCRSKGRGQGGAHAPPSCFPRK